MSPRSLARLLIAATIGVVVLLAGRLSGQNASASPVLTLLSRDARRAVPIVIVNGQEFIALDDLAPVFQLTIREDSLGAITVTYRGQTIILTPDQALASVAGRLISLPAAPVRAGRRWLAPIAFISRALAPIYETRLDLRPLSHLLVIGDLRVPRVTIQYEPLGVAARLTIDTTPRAATAVSQENDRLVIKVDADALDVASIPAVPASGLIQAIRLADAVTLAVDLGPRFAGFRASTQPGDATSRLVLDLMATQSGAAAMPSPVPAPTRDLPPALAPTPAIRTIVIDPGHGGEDGGARGTNGSLEKDLTLAVARRLKAVIETRLGIRVLLTREDDRSVPLGDRTALANTNKADVFVSLHVNASVRGSASGASIFCSAFDREAEEVAPGIASERLPAFGGGSRDIEMVPWDLAQIRHVDDSAELARLLDQQFTGRVPLAGHAIERALLPVLESANMPAVLIEMGFLSNVDQEARLATPEFQSVFVQAVFDTLVKFRDYLEQTRHAPAPSIGGAR